MVWTAERLRRRFSGRIKQKTDEGRERRGDLLFQFYAPRYCLRQARVSDGDSQNRTSSVCLRQTLCSKEKQKGQSLNLLVWRCLLSFTSLEKGTNLSDAPTKAMLRILRFARRRCWAFLLFGSPPHALRSGCYADDDCWIICVASRARSVRVKTKLRRTQPLPARGSVRARSAHRPIGPGACTRQPSLTRRQLSKGQDDHHCHAALFGSFSGGEKERSVRFLPI